jgi:hypothetical protein
MEMLLLLNTPKEQQYESRLVEPALATARKYRWQPDADAPETQIGFITVNFKLGIIYFNKSPHSQV